MITKVIGVTGGIGCGKSTLISILSKNKNIYIINTDNIAKDFMKPNGVCYKKIIKAFSSNILKEDGCIDNKKLSPIVMNDEKKLKKLNKIVHGKVIKEVAKRIKECKKSNTNEYDFIVIESALLLDTSLKDMCDEIWNVSADLEVRIKRLCKYRGYTREEVLRIMNNQESEDYYASKSTRTFVNNDDNDLEKTIQLIL